MAKGSKIEDVARQIWNDAIDAAMIECNRLIAREMFARSNHASDNDKFCADSYSREESIRWAYEEISGLKKGEE